MGKGEFSLCAMIEYVSVKEVSVNRAALSSPKSLNLQNKNLTQIIFISAIQNEGNNFLFQLEKLMNWGESEKNNRETILK